MSPHQPSNPVVGRLVTAINGGDRDAFMATLSPDATLTDGNPTSLASWIDREIFSVHGYLSIEPEEEEQGLCLLARYRNDTRGEMSTF